MDGSAQQSRDGRQRTHPWNSSTPPSSASSAPSPARRPPEGARRQRRQRQHARLPAARTSTSTPRCSAALRDRTTSPRRRLRRRPTSSAPDARRRQRHRHRRRVRRARARTASSTRRSLQVAKVAHRHHRVRDGRPLMGLFDASASRAAPSPPSACGWTSRPRTSPTRRPRAAPTASPTGARRSSSGAGTVAAASRRRSPPRRARRSGGPDGGVRVASIIEDQRSGPPRLRPEPSGRDHEGYVALPNVNSVTEMVDLITRRAPTRPTSPPCRPPSRCSPRPSTSCADADRPSIARPRHRLVDRQRRRPARLDGTRRPRASGQSFGGMLAEQIAELSRAAGRGREASQRARRRHRGRPSTAVVMAIERARLSMQLASQIRTKGVEALNEVLRTRRLMPMAIAHAPPCPVADHPRQGRVARRGSVARHRRGAFFMLQARLRAQLLDACHGRLDPAETGKITAALDEQGVGYELKNNGTALAVDKAMTAEARIALAEQGLPSGPAARLRAPRQAEARRLRLPAEGHLPARAGGPDRQHDRPDPGRLGRAGLAHAARGRSCSADEESAGHGGRAPQRRYGLARPRGGRAASPRSSRPRSRA